MDCVRTFASAASDAPTADDRWLDRVHAVLREIRALGFRASRSSVHAMLHFLLHRPGVALASPPSSDSDSDSDPDWVSVRLS
jgi:aryl-alcohol dehydrogenase-like predicted oxidoreductase